MCYKSANGDNGTLNYVSAPISSTFDIDFRNGRFMFACIKSVSIAYIKYTPTYAPHVYIGIKNNITELPLKSSGSSLITESFDVSSADYLWYVVTTPSTSQLIRFE